MDDQDAKDINPLTPLVFILLIQWIGAENHCMDDQDA